MNFSSFWTSWFYSLKRRFIVLEYHKRHFPGLYFVKTKFEKWPFLDQNHRLTCLEKYPYFLTFRTSSFYTLERRFIVLEYHKRYCPGLYCPKKIGKMASFGPKPGVNPFGKMSNFDFLDFLFLTKKIGKMAIFGPKPGVNPFGKMSKFDFLDLLFL